MARVAAVQMKSSDHVPDNIRRVVAWVELAASRGAKTIIFPENCLYLKHGSIELPQLKLDGPEIGEVQTAADKFNIEIVLGSVPLKIEHSSLASSTMIVLYPRSEGKGNRPTPIEYNKIHLFDVDLPSGKQVRESERYTAGHEPVVAPTRVGRLGLSICYDLRFPELYSNLTSLGATVFVVAADFFYETGKEHWTVLLRARAIESQCYVVASAQCGTHRDGHRSFGNSMIVDPWGTVLNQLDSEKEGIVTADINQSYVRHIRSTFPTLSHKRLFTS